MKQLKKLASTFITAVSAFVLQAASAFADITNPAVGDLGTDIEAAKDGSLFVRYFVQLWNVIISVGAIVVIVMFLWGALEWITAGGDTGKVQTAQKRIMNAAIGIFLLVASFAIIEFVSLIFFDGEFNVLNLSFPSGTAE